MYGTGLCFADRARGGLFESSVESSVGLGFATSVGLGFLGGGGFIEEETSVAASLCEADLVFGSGTGSRVGFRGRGGFIADDCR